jgi:anti-sigma factor RsiW
MIHRTIRRKLSAYVDGEIRGVEAAEMSRHVRECAECRGAAQLVCLMKQSLRRLGTRRSGEATAAQTAGRRRP